MFSRPTIPSLTPPEPRCVLLICPDGPEETPLAENICVYYEAPCWSDYRIDELSLLLFFGDNNEAGTPALASSTTAFVLGFFCAVKTPGAALDDSVTFFDDISFDLLLNELFLISGNRLMECSLRSLLSFDLWTWITISL